MRGRCRSSTPWSCWSRVSHSVIGSLWPLQRVPATVRARSACHTSNEPSKSTSRLGRTTTPVSAGAPVYTSSALALCPAAAAFASDDHCRVAAGDACRCADDHRIPARSCDQAFRRDAAGGRLIFGRMRNTEKCRERLGKAVSWHLASATWVHHSHPRPGTASRCHTAQCHSAPPCLAPFAPQPC